MSVTDGGPSDGAPSWEQSHGRLAKEARELRARVAELEAELDEARTMQARQREIDVHDKRRRRDR